jgi:hypothetical protein
MLFYKMNYTFPVRSLVKSRKNLREISNNPAVLSKFRCFDAALDIIDEQITKRIQERKTRYIFDGTNFSMGNGRMQMIQQTIQPVGNMQMIQQLIQPVGNKHFYTELMENLEFRNEFMEILKKEYPDCIIEYVDPRIENGKIIFPLMYIDIDWT